MIRCVWRKSAAHAMGADVALGAGASVVLGANGAQWRKSADETGGEKRDSNL